MKKSEILKKIFESIEELGQVKTENCLSEDTIWDLLEGRIAEKDKNKLLSHIYDCPYCLNLYSEVNLYLNPPDVKVPEEISSAVDRAIDEVIFYKSTIEINFTHIKEKSNLLINKIIQFSKKLTKEIPFTLQPDFAMGGNDKTLKKKIYFFQTEELEVNVYFKENTITIILEEAEKESGRKKIDDYLVAMIVKNMEPEWRKPSNGIVKFTDIKNEKFKVYIE